MAIHAWSPTSSIPAPRDDDHELEARLAQVEAVEKQGPGVRGYSSARSEANYYRSRIAQRDANNAERQRLRDMADRGDPAELADAVLDQIRGPR